MKHLFLALAALLLWSSPATAAAPVRPAAQACEEFAAPYRIDRQVTIGALPVGRVTVWSCTSYQDALDQAAGSEAAVKRDSCERFGRCEGRTP